MRWASHHRQSATAFEQVRSAAAERGPRHARPTFRPTERHYRRAQLPPPGPPRGCTARRLQPRRLACGIRPPHVGVARNPWLLSLFRHSYQTTVTKWRYSNRATSAQPGTTRPIRAAYRLTRSGPVGPHSLAIRAAALFNAQGCGTPRHGLNCYAKGIGHAKFAHLERATLGVAVHSGASACASATPCTRPLARGAKNLFRAASRPKNPATCA